MTSRSKSRILVEAALAALVLLLLVASRDGGAPATVNAVHCPNPLQSGGDGSLYSAYPTTRFFQPIGTIGNFYEADLDIQTTTFAGGTFRLSLWNPLTLAPDPTTVALRSITYYTSALAWYAGVHATFDPPVVMRTVPGLAEAPAPALAIDYQIIQNGYGAVRQDLPYTQDGNPATPAARVQANPMPGSHPVLSHALCGDGPLVGSDVVCQSVMRCDSAVTGRYALAQKFRVPFATRLGWVELAFATPSGYAPGLIAILDAQGATNPPATYGSALTTASFTPATEVWSSHVPFDQSIVLQPEHDYWLRVTTAQFNAVHTHRRTGTEGPYFQSSIGSFWNQPVANGPWFQLPSQALDFRILGEMLSWTAVGAAPAPGALRLTAAPNPARARPTLRWSGARGAVDLELFDPSGRRVASGEGAGIEGRWTASGMPAGARSGVYFAVARDASGQSASLQFSLVR